MRYVKPPSVVLQLILMSEIFLLNRRLCPPRLDHLLSACSHSPSYVAGPADRPLSSALVSALAPESSAATTILSVSLRAYLLNQVQIPLLSLLI